MVNLLNHIKFPFNDNDQIKLINDFRFLYYSNILDMERQPADGCDGFLSEEQRTAGDGVESDTLVPINDHNNNNEINFNNNRKESIGNEDLSKLRCSSLQIEELQKRKNRLRSNGTSLNGTSPVYPGLAFVSPMYSNALFRFSIIANEIKDLKSNQLKKVSIICQT